MAVRCRRRWPSVLAVGGIVRRRKLRTCCRGPTCARRRLIIQYRSGSFQLAVRVTKVLPSDELATNGR
jgi:hypothetical protein